MKQKFFNALDQVRSNSTFSRWITTALVLGAGGAASAQTVSGTNAMNGLGLTEMISTAAEGIRNLITNNSGPLVLALLPVMGFFFIWGRIRSLF